MKIQFLGTKAYIEPTSRRHKRHSSAIVSHAGKRLRIDCGADWLGRAGEGDPDEIVLTHAHPDHAGGLEEGAPCRVWATPEAWEDIGGFPIDERGTIEQRAPVEIAGMTVEAFGVEHSTRCPAVGLRISAGEATLFYCPDVVSILERSAALRDVDLYVGDGSTVETSLVRTVEGHVVGHTTIRAQLGWCAEEGVPRALFTHCGSDIVEGDERSVGPKIERMGRERGVEAGIAHDGMEVLIR